MTDETVIEEPVSLRDDLAAALAADVASQTPEPVLDGVKPITAIPDPAAPASPTPAASRDEAGRFAKTQEPVTPVIEPAPGALEPAATQTVTPPPSWSATAKAEFSTLSPVIQAEIIKREGDIERGKAQWDQKAEKFNRLESVVAPRRDRIAIAGVSEDQYIGQLFAADEWLQRDPNTAILALARQYGANLPALMQGSAPSYQPAQAPFHPVIEQLSQQVSALQSQSEQQKQAAALAAETEVKAAIEAFKSDPKHIYFENVRNEMSHLVRTEQAKDLADAYEQAIWASREIRPLLLKEQQDAASLLAQANAKAKAEAARKASGSITGSPSPGSSVNGHAGLSLRDELKRNWDAAV